MNSNSIQAWQSHRSLFNTSYNPATTAITATVVVNKWGGKRLILSLITLILLSLILSTTQSIHAQRERKNIFCFDCTGSMSDNGLWLPAKDALHQTVSSRGNNPEFVIIPFGDNAYPSIKFTSQSYNRKGNEDSFDNYKQKAKHTNISDALTTAFAQVDNNKDNTIYILTDGTPNGSDSPESVAQTIRNWCGNHGSADILGGYGGVQE